MSKKLKAHIGQIYLKGKQDSNFVSVYQESFRKSGKTVDLFAVTEIDNEGKPLDTEERSEFENVNHIIVSALKKAFVSAESLNENVFENALALVNSSLAKLAAKKKPNWYGKLNVVLAVFNDNLLTVSTAGNGEAYLVRDGEMTLVSDQSEEEVKPVKIFSTFTTGGLTTDDRILLTTKQILNYLSVERLHEFLSEEKLEHVCEDIIEALNENKGVGFAAFAIEASASEKPLSTRITPAEIQEKKPKRLIGLEKIKSQKTLALIFAGLWEIVKWVFIFFQKIIQILFRLIGRKTPSLTLSSGLKGESKSSTQKKTLVRNGIIVGVIILVLAIAVVAIQNQAKRNKEEVEAKFAEIESQLDDAEARLVFNDTSTVVELLNESESELAELSDNQETERYQNLSSRLEQLKNKVEKKTVVENPTVLADFTNSPSDISWSNNGFLSFNKNTKNFNFYDFRTGDTAEILGDDNKNNLVQGDYVGGTHGYVFLNKDGEFQKINVSNDTIENYDEPTTSVSNINDRRIIDVDVFGSGNSARIYLLDTESDSILRSSVTDNGISTAENWLNSTADFSNALDFDIDGSIYVLFPDGVAEYFNGNSQSFSLSPVIPELKSAVKIFVNENTQYIYILDPNNQRILVFDKNGELAQQIISDSFRELLDLHVDESSGILYVLNGSQLLQLKIEL